VVAERIIDAVATAFPIGDTDVFISASIGVAVAEGDTDAEALLADADLAMYRAKERGKGVHELFDESMRSLVVERVAMEKALRGGIDNGELVAHYQPVIDLETGTLAGMEALVRWQHPERGLLPPSEFVTLAEDTNLIGRVGEWMMREACAQARRWRDVHPTAPPIWVAVNLSVKELQQHRLAEDLAALLTANDLPPETLALEVTESVVMDDAKPVIRTLWELKELGVRLVIDDFGTGYSSLDRLRRIPVETLKIDRSFIADMGEVPGGTSLVAAIIAMAHSLGLGVIAEGVEQPQMLQELRRLGCDQFQGYLVARPAAAADIEPFLAAGREPAIVLPASYGLSVADLEAEVVRVVSQAFTDRVDVARTTRSLMAELRRLAGIDDAF
jgi:EAL domain-containing protein (putative c-di-GMP-specific phosphodiesterase class I)